MRRVRRSRVDRGAAAVEFALVMPILFALLFGIIDYGAYFADALSVRQATSEGARLAAVRKATDAWGTTSGCHTWIPLDTSGTADTGKLEALACTVQKSAGTLSGPVYVKVRVLDGTTLTNDHPHDAAFGAPGTPNWQVGNTVRVCALQEHASLVGFIPVPDRVTNRADMPIEDTGSGLDLSGGYQVLPDGQTWPDWC